MQEVNLTATPSPQKFSIWQNIFGRIWCLWGLISFISTFLIIFLPSMGAYLFKNYNRGQDYFIAVSRVWMASWLWIIGCPVKVTGKKYFKKGQPYIIVYNHNALLDVPLSAPFVPSGNKTIAKSSFAKVPIFGWFYKRGSILVDRKDDRSRVKSFDEMRKTLKAGMHMCIYPEGTRNRTNQPMKPFFDGAFKLATGTKVEVLPCVISGTKRAMPIHKSFYLWPTKLQMDFLEPVSASDTDTKTLKEKVFVIMERHYVEKNGH
jgi:1-acyl-sn-glycerol-3-phosphate acyltransferase